MPPAAPQPLTVDEVWQDLRLHVKWARGFSLVLLFSSSPGAISELRRRLDDYLRVRIAALQVLEPNEPARLFDAVLPVLTASDSAHAEMNAPLWLELWRHSLDADWEAARANFLARLNERRSLLEAKFGRPLAIVLPAGYARRFAGLAPDLWHIRVVSAEFDLMTAPAVETDSRATARALREGIVLSEEELPTAARNWFRLRRSADPTRISLWDGFAAVDELLERGALRQAEEIARDVRSIAAGRSESLTAVRDLSVAWNKLGEVALALGRLEEAEQAYREGLVLRQKLHREAPSPQSARDSLGLVEQARRCGAGAGQAGRSRAGLPRKFGAEAEAAPRSAESAIGARPLDLVGEARRCGAGAGQAGRSRAGLPRKFGAEAEAAPRSAESAIGARPLDLVEQARRCGAGAGQAGRSRAGLPRRFDAERKAAPRSAESAVGARPLDLLEQARRCGAGAGQAGRSRAGLPRRFDAERKAAPRTAESAVGARPLGLVGEARRCGAGAGQAGRSRAGFPRKFGAEAEAAPRSAESAIGARRSRSRGTSSAMWRRRWAGWKKPSGVTAKVWR